MTDQDPNAGAQPETQYRIEVDHFDTLEPNVADMAWHILNEEHILAYMVAAVLRNLPDPATWRLTVTADFVQTVNRFEGRALDNSYTTERGAGAAGAKTIDNGDGTYEIVVSVHTLFPTYEIAEFSDFVEYIKTVAQHLALHESGHALLHNNGEDSEAFQELATGTKTERSWRKHLAAHIDDFRIEKMTQATHPSPLSQSEFLGDALADMREKLTVASAMSASDGETAAYQSGTAINDLVRVMTYLAAELGAGGKITTGMRPDPLPEGWDEYLEEVWDAWALQLDLLKPADESMTPQEIAAVLDNLCKIVVVWSENIVGYVFEMYDDNSWTAYWARTEY